MKKEELKKEIPVKKPEKKEKEVKKDDSNKKEKEEPERTIHGCTKCTCLGFTQNCPLNPLLF